MGVTNKAGDSIETENANWSFGGDVPNMFDSHVSRSVPLYNEGHELILKLADYFLHNDSVCYDLGCSTGELIRKITEHTNKDIKFIGVDCENSMLNKARGKSYGKHNVDFIEGDLENIELEKSDLIICYYTIQFIPPKYRQQLIDTIYESLNWGGAFILFEKVRAPDSRFQDIMTGVYTDYKLDQGYNAEEIINKSRSLKGILEPFSLKGNTDLLERAGFVDYMSVSKYISFEGILAIK